MKNLIISVEDLHASFARINKDCHYVISFADVEYYAQQISNIFDVTEARAHQLAEDLAKLDASLPG